ncbi:MAG: YdbH domain-containing protein [Oleispira sp.]|nr:YdbH domain-containing protein [Oleispira sp.]MBL4880096.1 YdbH domain-containing protein [Oleispira sp.]
MRSWVKALLISAMTLLLVIVFLPSLAKPGLNRLLPWILQQADLENIEVEISKVGWYGLSLERLAFTSPATDSLLEELSLQQLEISYSPSQLLSGQVDTISIDQLSLILAEQPLQEASTLTEKAPQESALENEIILPNAQEIFALLPMDTLSINQLSISHPQVKLDSQLYINQQEISLHSTISLPTLKQPLFQQFNFNNQGILTAQIRSDKSAVPIFILQGEWHDQLASQLESKKESQKNKTIKLSLQQSADIESWLGLINNDNKASQLSAKTAIQVWSLELSLPKYIDNPNQILQKISGEGLFQIQINDFSIVPEDKNTPKLLTHADLVINAKTNINYIVKNQQEKSWQLLIENFDFKGTTQAVDDLAINVQQKLSQPLNINCLLSDNSDFNCHWQGKLQQVLQAEKINNEITMDISGAFNNSIESGSEFTLQKHLDINLKQNNERWPRLTNKTSGDIIFTAQKNVQVTGDDFWHWQLNLPFGLNSKTTYNEPLPDALAQGELSQINWQLLPDWQLQGIDSELTDAKALNILVRDLSWVETKNSSKKKSFILEQAELSCAFDWLKLQYSPQLRSSSTLESLPLSCDWKVENRASHWQEWPVPALTFTGSVHLSSLDFSHTKMRTEAKLIGLKQRLDFSLHAQHDFSGMQKGAAQLYLNNLNLEWDELGLTEMMDLTQAQLLGGTLSAQGWLQWQQYQEDIFDDDSIAWRWQPDIMLRADDLAGIYNNTTAWEDVDIQMAIRRPFYQSFKLVSQISANSLNAGIEISNILARSTTTIEPDFSKALVVIEEIHSDVLGGQVKVPLIRFDTSQEINAFGIEIEGLQLSQLAALEAGSGISVTGTLDGLLPIILLPQGPQVPAGILYARSPGGVVKYQNQVASALKESDPSVSLAMQILEDFHYDKLQTNITYQPNGELKLGLQFQGKNPTFFDGQATHLNLNLDYNLLDLLESLRISNDIVQTLENKYQ